MKKALQVLMYLLFAMTSLYPVGILITSCLKYEFELFSVSIFSIALAVLSVGVIVLDASSKNTMEDNLLRILAAVLMPVSLINAFFCILECHRIWAIGCVWISVGCCYYLAVKYGKPVALQLIAFVLSLLMIPPLLLFSFFAMTFGNIGQNTVVETIESPHGKYYAQVIDSNQGMLGGDTFVDVYQSNEINALLFKIRKRERIYSGEWGEFEYMQIHWKNNNCLVIGSVEYTIE